ncbi:MAG: ABC transporter permease [Deltaproteobacteria bacterium]|nr:ABC transporter permease [Deltaproteobacteria bacterium]
MLIRDFIRLTTGSITAQRMRSFLTGLGIAVGIAAVVLLTSIGEGLNRFVVSEFTQFGTNLIGINPGRVTTMGTPLGVLGSVRLLTLGDVEALRRVPHVKAVIPWIWGNAEVEGGRKRRRTTIYGVGPEMPVVLRIKVSAGRFLPADDPDAPRAFAVLGSKMRKELFSTTNPLGQRIRIGGDRFRVIGTMESKGQILGFDMDDTVYIPTVRGMELFNREGLMEIDVLYSEGASVDEVVAGIRRVLMARHGREDFTITTQQQMLDVLSSVLDVLTIAVGALGGISLLVGCVGILTVMTIAVNERTAEIGLLRALGATHIQVLVLFLGEAVVLAAIGGLAGMAIGAGGAQLIHFFLPALPVHTPWFYVLLAEMLAAAIGLIAGVLPAWRAARLDPVEALREE